MAKDNPESADYSDSMKRINLQTGDTQKTVDVEKDTKGSKLKLKTVNTITL